MSEQDKTQPSIEVSNDSITDWIMGSDTDISVTPSSSSTAVPRIPKVPGSVKEKHNYDKYYVPKFVSIGPYHFGDPKLQLVEKRKRVIAKKLFSNNKEALTSLYEKLGEQEMVKDLRSFYEANSTTKYCDKVFTNMMLLDGCFIVYFILFLYHGSPEDYPELKSNEIFFVRRDLYLLENQIPLIVLKEVVTMIRFKNSIDWLGYFKRFIAFSSFVMRTRSKRKWLDSLNIIRSRKKSDEEDEEPNHLLGAVHGKNTMITKAPMGTIDPRKFHGYYFRNVSELVDLGIHFKPINDTLSMTHIEFVKGQWGFSANVKLPPVAVTDYTKPMLLNLMAYETCLGSLNDSWVTSYIYLLNYLIDNAEDVKVLRKSSVLTNYLVSDQEVVKLFDEIGTDLIENSSAYLLAKYKIQEHYESGSNTLLSQLKKEYFKSPWAIFALLGALIALFLSAVQTFYTVWSPEGKCDDLCMFLKKSHHL